MSIDNLRDRQRQALTKSGHRNLWLALSESMSMQHGHFHRLQTLHGKYCHATVATLPDGWTDIVGKFLAAIDDLGDLADTVSLRFERCPDGARAFAFPEMSRWHPHQMHSLRIAQRTLLHASRDTCECCGADKAIPCDLGDHSFFLCQEHQGAVQQKVAALTEAMDERARFREQVSEILPPTTALLLPMSDYNTRIMRKALVDIKAIVVGQNLIGHVTVTKVVESDGQLFMTVRSGPQVDPATQFELADIVKHAEFQSDQAHLKSERRAMMTHDEYVAYIRERFSDLFDPTNTDQDWQYLITIGPGWWPLFEDYCVQVEGVLRHHDEIGRWYIRQAKEKFGELRIYMRPAPYERPDIDGFMEWVDDIDPPAPTPVETLLSDLRTQIVGQAAHVCEECGEPGEMRVLDGWYSTCCDLHFTEWQERKAAR